MKKLAAMGLGAVLMLSPGLQAKTVSGVALEDTLTIDTQQLVLNGAGVRSKFFMDLYVGSLYLSSPSAQVEQVINEPLSVIRLNITSGMITSDKMIDAINEGFEAATDGQTDAISAEITQFMNLFTAEIVKGDQFTFVLTKDQGVSSFKNNQKQGEIKGEAFRQALINIWLGDKPAQKNLKKAMLGN